MEIRAGQKTCKPTQTGLPVWTEPHRAGYTVKPGGADTEKWFLLVCSSRFWVGRSNPSKPYSTICMFLVRPNINTQPNNENQTLILFLLLPHPQTTLC